MQEFTAILQCPETGRELRCTPNGDLAAADGGPTYKCSDGVAFLLPLQNDADAAAFYENEGWKEDDKGICGETKRFVDIRRVSLGYTRKCMARLNKYFSRGGRYLLDAGSGAIPFPELLAYGERFERRVCVDLSVVGLRAAKSKLGDRGIYLQGDLTNLPLKSETMDAITCNHVIYQIPAEKQAAAFLELWRVLKPGGVGVIVYAWPEAKLAWRIERIAKLFAGNRAPISDAAPTPSSPALYDHAHSQAWFQAQNWPFRYRIETFRLVTNSFMRTYVSDDWRGSALLNALFTLQTLAPGYCGMHGAFPTILIYKD